MNRAQNSFVDEQLEQVQSIHDELHCYFADHKTMQIRPATTYDLSDKSRIFFLDLRDAPNSEFEAIRQHVRNMKPYMLTAQHVKSVPPNTEKWLRKRYDENDDINMNNETKRETNYSMNNK